MRPICSPLVLAVAASLFFHPEILRAQAPAAVPEVSAAELAPPVLERNAKGEVTIQCATPGALIMYSLDGVDPGPKTGPYLAPIAFPSGGVVKARSLSADRKQK